MNAGDVNDAKTIAQIVRDGNRITDQPTSMGSQEDVVTDIFGSAGRDHQIVHDQILGTHGDDGDDFLNDVNNYRWHDGGTAAAGLFGRTNEFHAGPESTIAAETAEKYANYLASHHDQLMQPIPNWCAATLTVSQIPHTQWRRTRATR